MPSIDFSDAPVPFSAKLPGFVDRCRERAASPSHRALVSLVASRVAEVLPAYLAARPGDTRLEEVFQAAQEAHEGRGDAERLAAVTDAWEAVDGDMTEYDFDDATKTAFWAVSAFYEAMWDDGEWVAALGLADRAMGAMSQPEQATACQEAA
ncbi:Hypothetical protein HVIM_02757 [Roseomonas mucosa]|uniref:hypothetical protein n=1 Tax=Roseomonas mucosa TaxID=207340 RepID=UPI0024CA2429|nr:hypothetical protein [Roseomonas mucosa]QDD95633.1 Hypothetical protein HVIM_02757 [Roseomonas mucosa]